MDHPAKILWPILEKQDIQKLEAEQAERIKRAEARAKQRKLLQAAVQARQEADQAIKELCEIDPDIFVGESTASGDISSDILNDTDKEDQVVIMADFDQENGTDGEKALEKMSQIQCPFNVSGTWRPVGANRNQIPMVKENGPSKAAPIRNQGGGKVIVKNHQNSVQKRHLFQTQAGVAWPFWGKKSSVVG